MVYIKNNKTLYPLNEELRITNKGLNIGDTEITSGKDNQMKYYFEEIQKQIKDGVKIINLNELIGSYKEEK
jgi:hypothetical protein